MLIFALNLIRPLIAAAANVDIKRSRVLTLGPILLLLVALSNRFSDRTTSRTLGIFAPAIVTKNISAAHAVLHRALLILAVETGGEVLIGIADEQNEVVWFFIFASLGAGIVEEVIFRGFLVVENKGRVLLIASCILFSFLFAVLHPYLWEFDYPEDVAMWKFWMADFRLIFTTKAFFTTAILFANSLWFYALRFGPWNKNRSLFPCMLAHAVSNFGVFVVKFIQGSILF